MKQSALSQRLESVRQEMSYSAGGVEDIAANTEDATVESSRLASDDLAHYVLIKGNVDKEEDAAEVDTETKPAEAAAEDGEDEDEEWNPVPRRKSSSQCRMNDQFVIRKIERDRNSGTKFAPVCEVKLSSSGSSSDEDDDYKRRSSDIKSADIKFSSSVAADQSRTYIDNSNVSKSAEEKRKLPPPEDVVESKRWKSEESSDSDVEIRPRRAVKSRPILEETNEMDQDSPTAPISSIIPVTPVSPVLPHLEPSAAPGTADIPLQEEVTDEPTSALGTADIQPREEVADKPVEAPGTADIPSPEEVTDKQDKPGPEANNRTEEMSEINAETGEVCHKEPTNG